LEVDLRTPREMGGDGEGTNPEQLFAVGYAACFESALGAVARRRRVEIADVAIDSSVMLIPTESRGYTLAVTLAVTLPSIGDELEVVELVRAAHEVWPYSNATRGTIDVLLTANGHGVSPPTRWLLTSPVRPAHPATHRRLRSAAGPTKADALNTPEHHRPTHRANAAIHHRRRRVRPRGFRL
jgi:Ohr subfamily peroxiredoxin